LAGDGALLMMRDRDGTREWPLNEASRLTIGRDPDADVHLPDRQVSRLHATLVCSDDGWSVVDHGSKNGTWLNGKPVGTEASQALSDGDELSIAARYKLFFVDADATAPLVFEPRGLRVDPGTLDVFVNGERIDPPLSGPQFELLALLLDAGGSLVTRDEIAERVWPDADSSGVSEDAIDALVRRTRLRLAEIDPDHRYILNVRGYGFRLELP